MLRSECRENRSAWANKGRADLTLLAFAGLGGCLHLPLFGHDGHIEQSKRQHHHHENECHEVNIIAPTGCAKITVVPAQ
jgi:hypothetical protein